MNRMIISLCAAVTCWLFGVRAHCESVTIDHVDGLHSQDSIRSEMSIVFHIRMTFGDDTYWGICNGFRVYSPDSAEWDTTVGGWTESVTDSMFPDEWHMVNYFSADGSGADTVGFSGFRWLEGSGIPPDFDAIVCTVGIGPIEPAFEGRTVCIDSSFYRPFNRWKWVSTTDDWHAYYPTWDGPHCFTIVPCCELRGDVDDDGSGPTMADLIYLNEYINSNGPEPPCRDQADVDGSGQIDIADLVYLVAYMFSGGPAPVPCP